MILGKRLIPNFLELRSWRLKEIEICIALVNFDKRKETFNVVSPRGAAMKGGGWLSSQPREFSSFVFISPHHRLSPLFHLAFSQRCCLVRKPLNCRQASSSTESLDMKTLCHRLKEKGVTVQHLDWDFFFIDFSWTPRRNNTNWERTAD